MRKSYTCTTICFLISLIFNGLHAQITLTSLASPATTASQGQGAARVYDMQITNGPDADVTINQLSFTMLGTYVPADLTGVDVIISSTSSFSAGLAVVASSGTIQPSGTQFVLNSGFTISAGSTRYLRIRVNVAANATDGHTVFVNGETHPVQFGFTSSPIVANNQSNLSGSIILPLKLAYLNVQNKNKWAEISWATLAEYSMQQYEIEHSTNGIQFQVVGKLPANATLSPQNNQYSFLHKHPMVGANYYRLRMTVLSGEVTISGVVLLTYNGEVTKTQLYPNPAKNQAMLKINLTNAGIANCRLVQYNGATVWQIQQALPQGHSAIPVNLNQIASGMYLIICTTPEGTETMRLMIRK